MESEVDDGASKYTAKSKKSHRKRNLAKKRDRSPQEASIMNPGFDMSGFRVNPNMIGMNGEGFIPPIGINPMMMPPGGSHTMMPNSMLVPP